MENFLKINPESESKKIVSFFKTTFKSQGFKKGIIAVSGGIDSAVSLNLAVIALGKDNIFTLQLPYKRQSVKQSNLIIKSLGIPAYQQLIINLNRPVDKLAVKLNARKDQLRLGNIIARSRMICLFDQAKKHHCLVIGTENKSENLLGYFTRFGDAASDVEPLAHLYKTQVIALAKHLQIPDAIISQSPSAGLWPDQTDEKELGFSYQDADPILNLIFDHKLSEKKVIARDFDQKLVKKVVKRLNTIDFKHHVPYHL